MDAGQGYLCTLDLVKNNARDGQTTSKTQLSTQDIVSNDAKDSAKLTLVRTRRILLMLPILYMTLPTMK